MSMQLGGLFPFTFHILQSVHTSIKTVVSHGCHVKSKSNNTGDWQESLLSMNVSSQPAPIARVLPDRSSVVEFHPPYIIGLFEQIISWLVSEHPSSLALLLPWDIGFDSGRRAWANGPQGSANKHWAKPIPGTTPLKATDESGSFSRSWWNPQVMGRICLGRSRPQKVGKFQ